MAISPIQDPLLAAVPIVDGFKVLEPAVLVEKLPEGGMAAVYRGLHLDLKVDVAVKVLKRTGAEGYSPQSVARFRQEAEQAARLNDPNLVRIYDFPANKIGLLYLVMEYIDGETLESRTQRRGRLNPHETVTIAYLSAKGLAGAHAENVIHRDIKPPNILLSKRGQVKVTDLGIAKATDSAAMGMTQEITLLGTPQYMAPELWRGARFASPASDVYAMGATIAFMLTGRHVLDGADTQEIMHRVLTEGFPDISRMVPGIPPPLLNIIRLCTLPSPKERIGVNDLILLLREQLDLFNGEFPLADPTAGTAFQPVQAGRLPSRSDLARIREQLEQIKIPTPIPGTMVVRDNPATVVAQAAAQGRVDLFGMNGAPPTQAFVRPRGRPVKKGGAGKAIAAVVVLGLVGGGGYYAWDQGWLNGNTKVAQNGNNGGTTQPITTKVGPDSGNNTGTQQGTTGINTGTNGNSGTNGSKPGPTTDQGTNPGPGPTKPVIPFKPLVDPTKPVGDPSKPTKPVDPPVNPPDKPVEPPVKPVEPPVKPVEPPVKPVEPPVKPVEPPKQTPYERARKVVADAADKSSWPEFFSNLREAWNAAEGESKRQEFTTLVDQSLMKFRAENRELALRRSAFSDVLQKVAYVAEEGRSGAAALVAAEASLSIEGKGATRRYRSIDADNGFANVVVYLERARLGAHVGAKADAEEHLLECRLGQLEFLAGKTRWKDMIDWLKDLPVVSLRAAAATDPAAAGKLARCVDVVGSQLNVLWQANPEPAKVQAIAKDLDESLKTYADAGVPVASLLIAETLITYDAKGSLVAVKEGGVERAVALLEKARAGKDARVAAAATQFLLDTYNSAAQAQAERKAWGEMIATLAKSQNLITTGSAPGPQQQLLMQKFRETADRAVGELRKDNPDLDRRREQFPNLAADLRPLAESGVYAARLALAETTIGYEGEPRRAVSKGGDTDFRSSLPNLQACITSAECPPDIKTIAIGIEWDIFASYVRRDAEAKPFDPRRLKEGLQRLTKCAGTSVRQDEYAALLDAVLKGDAPERLSLRIQLAEDQLAVVESPKGLRQVTQRDPVVLNAVRKTLEGAKQAKDPDVKARANALIGEILALDTAPQSLGESYSAFMAAYDAKKGGKGDPLALIGLAWFYQLPDEKLAPIIAVNPQLQDVQRLGVREREATVMKLYREAAFSGDVFGNFLAGQYLYMAFDRTTENREQAERYFQAAMGKNHKQAAVWLTRVRAGR